MPSTDPYFSPVVRDWQEKRSISGRRQVYPLLLQDTDWLKIQALAQLYQLSAGDVVSSLVHQALFGIETAFPSEETLLAYLNQLRHVSRGSTRDSWR